MFSSPMLPLVCFLSIFLAQMPSIISSMPTGEAASSSDNSQQFVVEDFYLYAVYAGLNYTRLDNKTREVFDKITEMVYNNAAMTEEQKTELEIKFFDVADENKDGLLTSEEITETEIYLAVHFVKFQMNQRNMNAYERTLVQIRMKEFLSKLRNEIEPDVIRMIKKYDTDGDGKLSKKEAEESIKAEKNSFKIGKFKRAVDMKMAMENIMNLNERMSMIGNDAFEF